MSESKRQCSLSGLRWLGFFLLLGSMLYALDGKPAIGQDSLRCTDPERLVVDPERFTLIPRVVGDRYGRIHVALSSGSHNRYPDTDAIYYALYTQDHLGQPVDILVADDFASADSMVLSKKDRLLISWRFRDPSREGLRVSSAPLDLAGSAREWVTTEVAIGGVHLSDMAVDHQGRVHLVYVANEPASGVGQLRYVWSDDDGRSWAEPVDVSLFDAQQELTAHPKIYADGSGRVHLVWARATDVSDWIPEAIQYTWSEDSGQTWQRPEEVFAGTRAHFPSLLPGADPGKLYMTWMRGVGFGDSKYLRVSDDGGVTWTDPQVLFYDLPGLNGPLQIAIDSMGSEYLVMAGDDLDRGGATTIWLSQKPDQGSWSTPLAVSGELEASEFPQPAMVGGNQLHIFWLDWKERSVFHTACEVQAPPIPPEPTPPIAQPTQVERSPTPTITMTSVTSTPSPDLPDVPVVAESDLSIERNDPTLGVAAGIVPAVLLIAIVVGWRLVLRR